MMPLDLKTNDLMPISEKTPVEQLIKRLNFYFSDIVEKFSLIGGLLIKIDDKIDNLDKIMKAKTRGFKANQNKIAAKEGVSKKAAGAILASATRNASKAAKRKNPRLKKVK
jgi:hypothetical protein